MASNISEKDGDASIAYPQKDAPSANSNPERLTGISLEKNGIQLQPQPTSDPLDPLNWSKAQKNTVLGIVMFKYFLFTYITTTTVPSFVELQDQFAITYAQVNWTVAVPALGLAVGPLLYSSPADIYGRRVIFILGTLMAFAATIGAAGATSYGGYMAARFFQGLGVSPAATVGLAAINDMFFEHERGQKVGLWVLAIDTGLTVGPLIGGFLNLISAAWIQWFTAILFGVLLILELAFMPETLYPRTRMLTEAPLRGVTSNQQHAAGFDKEAHQLDDTIMSQLPRTKKLPFINYRSIPGLQVPAIYSTLQRFVLTFKYLPISLTVFVYCFMWYWWILSVITLLPVAYPTYSPQIQGLLFIGLLLGTLFSELFLGGTLSDFIVLRLFQRKGVKLPEMRLWLVYPAGLLSSIGLIVWGISIDRGYHWIVGQIAFFLFAAGIQSANTAVCAYMLDSYPLQSMSVVVFYSVGLNLSAFVNPFFIVPFQLAAGWTWCFVTQALIILFVALPGLAALHRFGPSLRQNTGVPNWVNPEFDQI